jgi:hypothetical protein
MRFLIMHATDERTEAGGPPPAKIIEEMGALVGQAIADKIFLDGAGLHPSAQRARVSPGGEVRRGPYAGEHELVASLAMIEADALDDAAAIAARAAQELGAELEVGRVVEPWDLGVAPDPGGMTPRFLVLAKGEAEPARHQRLVAALANDAPVLAQAALAPSKQGARSKKTDGKRSWTDGPFTESKELVGGYCILELPSIDDARRFADRYAEILGDNTVDVRVVI